MCPGPVAILVSLVDTVIWPVARHFGHIYANVKLASDRLA
jgi:hypothetical protein